MVYKAISKGIDVDDIFVFSLGTGRTQFSGKHADQSLFWKEHWEEDGPGHCITRQVEDADDELEDLLAPGHYIRIQPFLEHNVAFDQADEQTVLHLQEIAFQTLKANRQQMQ